MHETYITYTNWYRNNTKKEWYQLNIVNFTNAYQCVYVTDGDNFEESILEEWEDAFVELLGEIATDLGIDDEIAVSYNSFKSFDDELTRSIASDVSTFVLTLSKILHTCTCINN